MQAIQSAAQAVRAFTSALSTGKEAIAKIKEAFFWKQGVPLWLDGDMLRSVGDALKEVRDAVSKRSRRDGEKGIWSETKSALSEYIGTDGPFGVFNMIRAAIMDPFNIIASGIEFVKTLKKMIIQAYEGARFLLQSIFGPKFHKFVAKRVGGVEKQCGGPAVYPSDGGGRYETGVRLEIAEMEKTGHSKPFVFAPCDAVVTASGKNSLVLSPMTTALDKLLITMENVAPFVTRGQAIQAGQPIALVASSECGDGNYHLSVKKEPGMAATNSSKAKYIDPTPYLNLPKTPLGKWKQECDDYKLVFIGKTRASGSITGGKDSKNQTKLNRKFNQQNWNTDDFGLGKPTADPLGCGDGWYCELERNTGCAGGIPTTSGGCRHQRRRSTRSAALRSGLALYEGDRTAELQKPHERVMRLTIYGNDASDSVAVKACAAAGLAARTCKSRALKLGVAYPDLPCGAASAQDPNPRVCFFATCKSLGNKCARFIDGAQEHREDFLDDHDLVPGTISTLMKSVARQSPDKSSLAYQSHHGALQYWHSMAPSGEGAAATNQAVVDLIVAQATEWYQQAIDAASDSAAGAEDRSLFVMGKLLHMVQDAYAHSHVIRDEAMRVVQFQSLECQLGHRHGLAHPTDTGATVSTANYDHSVGASTKLFTLFSTRAPAAELEQYVDS